MYFTVLSLILIIYRAKTDSHLYERGTLMLYFLFTKHQMKVYRMSRSAAKEHSVSIKLLMYGGRASQSRNTIMCFYHD